LNQCSKHVFETPVLLIIANSLVRHKLRAAKGIENYKSSSQSAKKEPPLTVALFESVGISLKPVAARVRN
jgi:hypothetical protein